MWMPIESAPKDGETRVLGWEPTYFRDKGAVIVMMWVEDSWWDNAAWKVQPTHWRPLPEPPPENRSPIPEGEDAW